MQSWLCYNRIQSSTSKSERLSIIVQDAGRQHRDNSEQGRTKRTPVKATLKPQAGRPRSSRCTISGSWVMHEKNMQFSTGWVVMVHGRWKEWAMEEWHDLEECCWRKHLHQIGGICPVGNVKEGHTQPQVDDHKGTELLRQVGFGGASRSITGFANGRSIQGWFSLSGRMLVPGHRDCGCVLMDMSMPLLLMCVCVDVFRGMFTDMVMHLLFSVFVLVHGHVRSRFFFMGHS